MLFRYCEVEEYLLPLKLLFTLLLVLLLLALVLELTVIEAAVLVSGTEEEDVDVGWGGDSFLL